MADTNDIRALMRAQLQSRELLDLARDCAADYIENLERRPVYPDAASLSGLSVFDEALPDTPEDGRQILELLHEKGSPATVAQSGGRYYGFVNGSYTPTALAARWLADAWDQNPALNVISPVAAKLEQVCEGWLVELLGLPPETAAGFVSGTSTATLCGLAAGRYHLLKGLGCDVNQAGLADAPRLRVILGEQAHATVFKALALLGFGSAAFERVPVDEQGRMRADMLPPLDNHCLVIAQAGNVNSGAFDPLDEIGNKVRAAGAWLHVDGAFGLWAAAAASTRHLTRGLELADSWSADGHKTLNTPYDCGIILCRHRRSLVEALQMSGAYIQLSEQRDPMLYTSEMSRRARGVDLWATLKFFGRDGVEQLIDGLCARARQFAERLAGEGFRVLNEVVFNQVLVACDAPEQTTATLAALQQGGECWCGGSLWQGEPVIRISVCSWATSEEDVERSVAAFIAALREGGR